MIAAAEKINGGVLVVKKIGGQRVESEFRHDEVFGVRAHCEGLAATGHYEVVFVRYWTQNDLLPKGMQCGVRGESFLKIKKAGRVRRKVSAAA